jgi:hypothetical protein
MAKRVKSKNNKTTPKNKKLKPISDKPNLKRENWKNKGYVVVLRNEKGQLQFWQKWSKKKPIKEITVKKFTKSFRHSKRIITTYPQKNDVCQLKADWTLYNRVHQSIKATGFSYLHKPDSSYNVARMLKESLNHAKSKVNFSVEAYRLHTETVRYINWEMKQSHYKGRG